MAWSFYANSPVYQQIASRIRADILNGKYPAEEQFPSVRQLASEAAVNPNTMQRALSQLEQDGLLLSKGTAGRFVTEDKEILKMAKRNAAKELVLSFKRGCKQMGFSKDEIIQLLQEEEGIF